MIASPLSRLSNAAQRWRLGIGRGTGASFAPCGRLVTGTDRHSFRALWRPYRACRRNKQNTKDALAFEVDADVFAADFRGRAVFHDSYA